MLKPADPTPPESERPLGELASQLVDDAKAYARAEAEVAKAMAAEKANAVKTPLMLFAAATFVAMAALNALAVAIFVALDSLMGHLVAGILAFLLIGAVAAGLGWAGYSKLRRDL